MDRKDSASAKSTRNADTKLDKTLTEADADGDLNSNFYHEVNNNSFPGDTLLWHAKFIFTAIAGDATGAGYQNNAVAIINEAGIFNKNHSENNPIEDVIMLARRTFSEKPVKNADELTIKWQITIK